MTSLMHSHTNIINYDNPVETVDMLLACICILACVLGSTGNIISLIYFISNRTDLPTCINVYTVIAINDMLICTTIIPVVLSLVNHRDPVMFSNPIFCTAWGMLWDILPLMSVLLVSVLTITRTIKLLYPIKVINEKTVMGSIGGSTLYVILRTTLPVILHRGEYTYCKITPYCLKTDITQYHILGTIIYAVEGLFPIFPITISCFISLYVLAKRSSNQSTKVTTMKRDASVTILLVTILYIVFNIPEFINWALHVYEAATVSFYTQLYVYRWVLTHVITTVCNATANPILYISRMKRFRQFIARVYTTCSCKIKHLLFQTPEINKHNS